MDLRLPRILMIGLPETEASDLVRRYATLGYEADAATEGSVGIAMAEAQPPDLILLHAGMAGALDIIKDLKDGECDIVPVVMLIPITQLDRIEVFLTAGAEDYLACPYSPTMLKVLTADYVEISQKRQEERTHQRQVTYYKIEHDVQVARDIQLNFLPSSLPQPEGWEVSAYFDPARQVAGDWYDAFFLASKRRVGFVVADVCDKGVGSALFMALLRSLIRAFAQQNLANQWFDTNLDDILTQGAQGAAGNSRRRNAPSTGTTSLRNAISITNNYMFENHGQLNYFATMFFGMFDPANGSISYVNAGHPPAMILNASGGVKERLKPTAPAVGLFPDADFVINETCLNPGESLFVFTDGVTDARDPNGKMFTEKRVIALLEEPLPSSQGLVDRIVKELNAHIATADQFDDITMMGITRKPG